MNRFNIDLEHYNLQLENRAYPKITNEISTKEQPVMYYNLSIANTKHYVTRFIIKSRNVDRYCKITYPASETYVSLLLIDDQPARQETTCSNVAARQPRYHMEPHNLELLRYL